MSVMPNEAKGQTIKTESGLCHIEGVHMIQESLR